MKKQRIILMGAGSSGKTTLKSALFDKLNPIGWGARDSSASGRKIKWGIDMKDPTESEKYFFQAMAFPIQLASDIEETTEHSVTERSSIDFFGWTKVLTPELAEEQFKLLQFAVDKGLYEHDLLYYLPPLKDFVHADNRFSDISVYKQVEKAILDTLSSLGIKFTCVRRETTVAQRINMVLDDLVTKGVISASIVTQLKEETKSN
jgi:predicted ATPase